MTDIERFLVVALVLLFAANIVGAIVFVYLHATKGQDRFE